MKNVNNWDLSPATKLWVFSGKTLAHLEMSPAQTVTIMGVWPAQILKILEMFWVSPTLVKNLGMSPQKLVENLGNVASANLCVCVLAKFQNTMWVVAIENEWCRQQKLRVLPAQILKNWEMLPTKNGGCRQLKILKISEILPTKNGGVVRANLKKG